MRLPLFSENISLVIWNLDDSLSQAAPDMGAGAIAPETVGIITALATRGIVSSLCAKAALAPIKQRLEAEDLWQWFVSPLIDPAFRPGMISALIAQTGLAAETILYVDSRQHLRGEVLAQVPGINVCSADSATQLLTHPQLEGTPDPLLTTLARHRTQAAAKIVPFKASEAPAAPKPAEPAATRPSVVFLHIPKTAGQSVDVFLRSLFPPAERSPARVNEHLVTMSISDIRQYKMYSGHMDWSMLDCLEGPRFTFTVLREPVSRIVSFYLYLLREAKRLTPEEVKQPQHAGKKAILELSCDEYFTAGPPGIRAFLDNHYDNFYAYYFAGRRFDARQRMISQQASDSSFSADRILAMALDNMALLDGVYSVDRLGLLEADLRAVTGRPAGGPTLENLRVNVGEASSIDERMEQLAKLGATNKTFERIQKMTVLDRQVWQTYCSDYAAPVSRAAP